MKTKPPARQAPGQFEQFWLSLPLEIRDFYLWAKESLPPGADLTLRIPQGSIVAAGITVEWQGLEIRRTNTAPRKSP